MTSVINLIRHYQRDIERCSENEERVLRCLSKLHQLGVTVQHLQDTGVGRTVNALRKEAGEVGMAARALVAKWKDMVANAEESSDEQDDNTNSGRDSGGDSDHNSNHSRNDSQSYESDHETGEYIPKSHKETNGETETVSKRHHDGYDDSSSKRTKYDVTVKEDLSDDDVEPYNDEEEEKKIQLNEEPNSDSESEQETTVKQEPKNEEKLENNFSKHSSKEHSEKSKLKKDNSKSLSHHRSEKQSSKHRDKSANDDINKKKEKESKHHSEKREKKNSSSLDKNKSSEKHESKSSEKHESKSSEKHESKSSKTSSEKEKTYKEKRISSSDKHKDAKHKGKTKESKNREQKEENGSGGSGHREKHRSSSSHKEKHNKYESAKSIEKSANKENSSASTSEISSKSKHSDKSSHSHKSSHDSSEHKSNEVKGTEKNASNADKHKSSSSHKSSRSKCKEEMPKKKSKSQKEGTDCDDGIGCESGTSFADALGMASPVKTKKKLTVQESPSPTYGSTSALKLNGAFPVPSSLLAPTAKLPPLEPLEISALPEISPNYKPRPPPKLLAAVSDEDALNYVMSTKNQRTKVFSGNKTYGKVLSLYELCVNILQEHIDALEYTGGVPYEIIKPVVDKATPEQLFQLEHFNPYLMEDTNHLWQKHCERRFRNKKRLEMESETWREMYLRCQEEQEARLKSLTANIKMAQDARNEPTKKTKMAYVDSMVKPPRNIARKQAIHGTARLAATSPAARVAALAGVGVAAAGSNPVRARPVGAAPSSSSSFKPKKAPLMQKALQFMRGRKR